MYDVKEMKTDDWAEIEFYTIGDMTEHEQEVADTELANNIVKIAKSLGFEAKWNGDVGHTIRVFICSEQ